MKEAVRRGDEELIPASVPDADLADTMNARSHRAGLTNRQGESCKSVRIMSHGFGPSRLNVWSRDADGELIE